MPNYIQDVNNLKKAVFVRFRSAANDPSTGGLFEWVSYTLSADPLSLYDYLLVLCRGSQSLARHLYMTLCLEDFQYMLFRNFKIRRSGDRIVFYIHESITYSEKL